MDRRTTKSGVAVATCLSEGNAALSPLLLDAVEGYLATYAKLLGPYPHAKFDVVENFFSTGYGMPSATLLGGDVIAHMGFRPRVARELKPMDARIFDPRLMGLAEQVHGKPRGYRSQRVAQWHETRKGAGKSATPSR